MTAERVTANSEKIHINEETSQRNLVFTEQVELKVSNNSKRIDGNSAIVDDLTSQISNVSYHLQVAGYPK